MGSPSTLLMRLQLIKKLTAWSHKTNSSYSEIIMGFVRMRVAEAATQGDWRGKAGRKERKRNWDEGFSVVSCLGVRGTARNKFSSLRPQNWIALGYLQEKQSCNNFLSFNNMLYIHEGAHAPAESGPNSSRLAQTVSFPPEGN